MGRVWPAQLGLGLLPPCAMSPGSSTGIYGKRRPDITPSPCRHLPDGPRIRWELTIGGPGSRDGLRREPDTVLRFTQALFRTQLWLAAHDATALTERAVTELDGEL